MHLMSRLLHLILNKTAVYDLTVTFDTFFLDLQRHDLLNDLEPPRFFCTHYPFDYLPDSVKDGRTKIVHVTRNPKAAFVSMYHMVQSIRR